MAEDGKKCLEALSIHVQFSYLINFLRFSELTRFSQIKTIVLKSLPAVVVLYFTASEKENLRTERKQNYLIKNEKKKETSDY